MGHKNVPNIVSLSHCLEQLYSCIFNSYLCKGKEETHVIFFYLLPVGLCIDAYVTIHSYFLCVSTHA